MATEFSRETSVRKVCPNPAPGADHVKLKVLDKISFIDEKSQYQEYEFSFNNGPLAARVTFAEDAGDELSVERIEKLSVIDPKDFFQESLFSFLRYQEGVHLKTHKRKIYALKPDGTKDEGIWIEVERVDQISFVDPKTQHQEYIYQLKWPDLVDPEWDYQNLTPVITEHDNTSINPPWRLDPFQNIVNSSFGAFDHLFIKIRWNPGGPKMPLIAVNGGYVLRVTMFSDIIGINNIGNLDINYDEAPYVLQSYHFDKDINDSSHAVDGWTYLFILADMKNAISPKNEIVFSVHGFWVANENFEYNYLGEPLPPISGIPPDQNVTITLQRTLGGSYESSGNVYLEPLNPTKSEELISFNGEVTAQIPSNFSSPPSDGGQLLVRVSFNVNSGAWKVL